MMATGWVRTRSGADKQTDSPPLKRQREGSPSYEDIFNAGSSTPPTHRLRRKKESKVFNDPVHGPIALDPLLVSIIDTPQFQRLRDIKQLGASYWVYPGGSHNRFEHCIGTSYLCGLLLKTLRDAHNEDYDDPIDITDTDILCVKVAGLCHDLGHGPFSHVFDMKYLKYVKPDSTWEHEKGSCDMFDFMLTSNCGLLKKFENHGLMEKERELIKDMIMGKNPGKNTINQKCVRNGKEYSKWFLYEVVSNKRNGIDCDKFDYFLRDCHYVGVKSNFDCHRYFQNVRILPVDEQLQICVRDKEVFNLYELFHTRWSLHHRVYQHKTTKIIEQMLVEAIALVDKEFGISASIEDPERYLYMTDSIIYEILRSRNKSPNFTRSKELLKRLQGRNLYRFCGQINPLSTQTYSNTPRESHFDPLDVAKELVADSEELKPEDVHVDIVEINFGMKQKNPVDNVMFFDKEGEPFQIQQHQISELLPQKFEEKFLRVYSKDPEKRSFLEREFVKWCEDRDYQIPRFLTGDSGGYYTDVHKSEEAQQSLFAERRKNAASAKRSLDHILLE